MNTINGADTAWVLTATALVLFMTLPGLALFYAGLVRLKNALSVMMHCVAIACLVSVLWLAVGYSLAFAPGSPLIGGLQKAFLLGVGRGSVLYLASGLEATYLETHAPVLLRFFSSLLSPWMKEPKYSLQAPVLLWGHLAEAPGQLVLHIFANTGNKWKKLQAREQFMPAGPVTARIRSARPVRRVWLWSSGKETVWQKDGSFVEVRLDRVDVHEGIVLEG